MRYFISFLRGQSRALLDVDARSTALVHSYLQPAYYFASLRWLLAVWFCLELSLPSETRLFCSCFGFLAAGYASKYASARVLEILSDVVELQRPGPHPPIL